MPSVDELNAGFDAIQPTLHEMTNQFVPDMFGYRDKINKAIDTDQQVRGLILDGVKEVLEAAEHVRAGKTPPAAKVPETLKAYIIKGTDIPDRPDIEGAN
jgi:hypothetical protein